MFWGTYKDNSEDMVRKGRQAYGEKCGVSKLTERDVFLIRRIKSMFPSMSGTVIAEIFQVKKSNITAILNGKTWTKELGEVDKAKEPIKELA